MEPTEEDSVPLRHGVGEGKASSSSALQWLPRKLPMHISDVALKMAVFALFVCQVMTWRELRHMNAKPTPPTPEIIDFSSPAPPTNGSSKAGIEYKIVSWDEDHMEGCSFPSADPETQTSFNPPNHLCLCSGKPCGDISSCTKCSYSRFDYERPPNSQRTNIPCGGAYEPKRLAEARTSRTSFIDVAKQEGLTNKDIYTDCSWPKYTETFTKFWNYSHVVDITKTFYGETGWKGTIDCGFGLKQFWSGFLVSNFGKHSNSWPDKMCSSDPVRDIYDTCLVESDVPKTFTYGSSWANASHAARSCVLEKLLTKMNRGKSSLRLLPIFDNYKDAITLKN